MINKYKTALNACMKEHQLRQLDGITNQNGITATWQDWVWRVKRPNGTVANFFFLDPNIVKQPRLNPTSDFTQEQRLTTLNAHICMCYLIDLLDERANSSTSYIQSRFLTCRFFLVHFNNDISTFNQLQLNDFIKLNAKRSFLRHMHSLLQWFKVNKLIRSTFVIPEISNKRRGINNSFESALDTEKKKMPDERALRALAAIFNQVVPKAEALREIKLNNPQRHSFVACMSAIAMSSPNRIVAEQPFISNQRVKSREATRIIDGEQVSQAVYWLDWRGSKGYKDNDNHILASLVEPVTRAIDFLRLVCEPARVLCRFYEDPEQPLNHLIGAFHFKKLSQFPKNKPVNLFQLGYILGFYDDSDGQIRLWHPSDSPRSHEKHYKHVSKLCATDVLRFNGASLEQLIGVSSKSIRTLERVVGKRPTVSEFQRNWIAHIKDSIPQFPNRVSETNSVRLSTALFNFTGQQITQRGEKSGYKLAGSYYAIESVGLGSLLSRKLIGHCDTETIFEDFNFSSNIRIRPHQFRHWLNTKSQESGLSDEVIAMWSGRNSVQQNAVYDHTTDSDKVARISELYTSADTPPKEIRVVTQEEYHQATGKVASVTATGICTQELSVNPCTYLNDFVAQCVLCSSSCHVNRDQKAIDILEKDLSVQQIRLEQARCSERLRTSTSTQNWFITHHSNTTRLEQLIDLMKREDIKRGSPIRFVRDSAVFRVTDLENRRIEEVKARLPDSRAELKKVLATTPEPRTVNENTALSNLLASFSLTQE